MSNQPRVAKVLAALLVSMTAGAVLLMALGNNAPLAGPFCLSSYYRLDPVEAAISSQTAQSPSRWNSVEIYYSRTKAGNIPQLASLSGLPNPQDINCHFVICNGFGENDGKIQTSEKWQRQWSCIPSQTWYGSSQTNRICVIGDGKASCLTDFQINRVSILIDGLCRKFQISPEYVYYPSNWQ